MNIAKKSSLKDNEMVFSTNSPSLPISDFSLVQDVQSYIKGLRMSLPQDSPANPSALPESEKALMMKETCGQRQQTLFGLSGLDSFCLKMCQEYANICPWSSETCGDLVIPFADPSSLGLTIAGRRIGEKGSGFWRTPRASDGEGGIMEMRPGTAGHYKLRDHVQPKNAHMWPTPRAGKTTDENEETWLKRQADGKVSTPPLTLAVKIWPTPKGSPSGPDFARIEREGSGGGDLATAVAKEIFPTPTSSMVTIQDMEQARYAGNDPERPRYSDVCPAPRSRDWEGKTRGSLNPDWVEALMSFPPGWSSLEPLSKETFEHWLNNHQWEDWEPIIPRIAKGVKDRVNRLKAIGNGQVPIVIATAWEILTGLNCSRAH